MEYLIIGNSAAAIGAVEGIRAYDRQGKITVVSDEPYSTYSRPLISYYLSGKVKPEKMAYRKPSFYQEQMVEVLLGKKAVKVEPQKKEVLLADGQSLKYDRLLLATGGKPFLPPLEGSTKDGVFTFQKMDDALQISKRVKAGTKAVVIGGGLIGLKAAEALAELKAQVTVVELADRILSTVLDQEAAYLVEKHLRKQGIGFELQNTAVKVIGGEKTEGVELKDGKKLPCELVIVAVGVVPNAELAKEAGIKVNRGIVVDEHLETSVSGIYAAGDVSEGADLLLQTERVLPLLPNAYKQGETAGKNMAGVKTAYPGGMAMNSIGFFGLPLVSCGLSTASAADGFEVLVRKEEENQIYRKLVIEDNRIVGLISVGAIEHTGIINWLIREKIVVVSFKEKLLAKDFGLHDLPYELRQEHLRGGAKIA